MTFIEDDWRGVLGWVSSYHNIYIYIKTGFDGWWSGVMADQCLFIIISTCSLRWND